MFSEMKKFYKNTAIVISLVLSIVVAIGMPILFIYDYASYDYSTGKEVVIKGVKGLNYKKEQMQKVSGILSTDKLKDRKSTRLNSSHANISYAVFCLKKKKNEHNSINVTSLLYPYLVYITTIPID